MISLPQRISKNFIKYYWYNEIKSLHIRRIELYKKCFRILGIEESADQNTVRWAYIELVKKIHPDSGFPEASKERFLEVDEAFKTLQKKFAKNRRGIMEDEEEKVFDIRHTAPQHRQYLNYEGMGIGNPYERQNQYQHIKAMRAHEHVMNYRIEKTQNGEKNIMKKGTYFKNHAIKTKLGFDRVVEDLIQESISKGDFDKLSGVGKPLSSAQSQNPYVDFTTQKLNKILIDNGFTPEWITLQRDIRLAIDNLKLLIKEERAFFGDYPLDNEDHIVWLDALKKFDDNVEQINKNIDKYNLIVPIMDKQMFRIDSKSIGDNILKDPTALKNFKPQRENMLKIDGANETNKSDFFSFLHSIF